VSGAGGGSAGRRFDYDQPRSNEEDILRGKLKGSEYDEGYTMGGRLDQINKVSPFQGTKVVIKNLHQSVTQDDIVELFGDIGALRRTKFCGPGHAEVTFVNQSDALKAVEIYHNRQLDGRPMKCQMVGVSSTVASAAPKVKLPSSISRSKSRTDGPPPDVESIHRALFNNKKSQDKQSFTLILPTKGKNEADYY